MIDSWGRDIFVPGAIAGLLTGGAAAVAGAEIYRAYTFEKNFWNWINTIISELGRGKASMTDPKVLEPQKDISRTIYVVRNFEDRICLKIKEDQR